MVPHILSAKSVIVELNNKTCRYCGIELQPDPPRGGPPRKFCSPEHGWRWHRQQLIIARTHYRAMLAAQNATAEISETVAAPVVAAPRGWDASTMRHQGRTATSEEIAAAQAPRVGGRQPKPVISGIFEGANPDNMPPGVSARRSHKRKA